MLIKQRIKSVIILSFTILGAVTGLIRPGLLAQPAMAKPAFMDRYNRDPFSKAERRGHCTICHVGHGGGERNDFGEAFEDSGFRITPRLRAKFPELFVQESPAAEHLP